MADATPAALGATAIDGPAPETTAVKSVVLRSEYDNLYGILARRSAIAAQIVRENPAFRDALRTAARWTIAYLVEKGLTVDQIIVNGRMTREGVVVLQIQERGAEDDD